MLWSVCALAVGIALLLLTDARVLAYVAVCGLALSAPLCLCVFVPLLLAAAFLSPPNTLRC